MKELTVAFLCELSRATGNTDLIRLLHRNMKEYATSQFNDILGDEGAVSFSSEVLKSKAQLNHVLDTIDGISVGHEAIAWMEQLNKLRMAFDSYILRTENELHKSNMDIDCLYWLSTGTQRTLHSRIERFVRIQTFRLLVLSDTDELFRIRLDPGHTTAELLEFYRLRIHPLLQAIPQHQLGKQWAVRAIERKAFGDFTIMPSYVFTEADESRIYLLPGQYIVRVVGEDCVYQGRGRITNITPDCIFEALREGIYEEISADEIDGTDIWREDPSELLSRSRHGYYAVKPQLLFSVLSYLCDRAVIEERFRHGLCLCCGSRIKATGAETSASKVKTLCENCQEIIRVKCRESH